MLAHWAVCALGKMEALRGSLSWVEVHYLNLLSSRPSSLCKRLASWTLAPEFLARVHLSLALPLSAEFLQDTGQPIPGHRRSALKGREEEPLQTQGASPAPALAWLQQAQIRQSVSPGKELGGPLSP